MTLALVAAGALALASGGVTVAAAPPLFSQQASGQARTRAHLTKEVRRELVMLPSYSVFDWLQGEVQPDGTIILQGQVRRDSLKAEAESAVKRLEGVGTVVNQIEVLPLSTNDERTRRVVHRALFNWNSPLFRYGVGAVPPIHIIVRRGEVTLKGVVESAGDRDLAYLLANGLPGVFKVTNELMVEPYYP
jgi:osmotically-inducible protein OsmY